MNLAVVPMYVTASSPDELVRVMLINNVKRGMVFKYFDIQKVGAKWYAWYTDDGNHLLRKRVDDELKKND